MKIVNVVKYIGRPKLEVIAENEDGYRRKIACNWLTKSNIVPKNWFETIKGEFAAQERKALLRAESESQD